MSNKSQTSLVEEYKHLLNGAKNGDLSKLLPSVLVFAKQVGDKELEKWTELEMNSYFSANKVLTDDVVVPEYRSVAGQYHDIYNRPLVITDPSYKFVSEYRLRHSVSELEKLESSTDLLSLQDPTFNRLIRQNFKFEATTFSFSPTCITGILSAIRTNLINKLVQLSPNIEQIISPDEPNGPHTPFHDAIGNLHPLIQPVAKKLCYDGHFRQAILDTYILLVDTVKTKSGRRDLDGTALMQTVFSPKAPVIKISSDPDEQQGYMWMFSGAVMGIRNPKAHNLIPQTDPQRTLELLSFASVLLRMLDDAEVVRVKQ